MLKVEGIETWYGAIQALKGISLDVNQGEIVALLGANGAGKSTTIKTISGLLKATKGSPVCRRDDASSRASPSWTT
jgi:branched-chain amino acid transport system ATP-binding protein